MAKENIVIVGGGGAGVGLARALSAKLDASRYNLILISARSKLVHLLAALRMLVTDEGKLEEKAVIPLDNVFVNGNGTLKVGKVVAVEKASGAGTGGDVVLESGERVPFRYVVLATGSLWEGPLALPDENDALLNWVQEWRTKFKNANDIVIVGAGAVGLGSTISFQSQMHLLTFVDRTCRRAKGRLPSKRSVFSNFRGESNVKFQTGKKITIVQADSLPLNSTYPDKFRKDVLRRWKERDIKFILGDRIDGQPEPSTELRTANGKTLKADLIVSFPPLLLSNKLMYHRLRRAEFAPTPTS